MELIDKSALVAEINRLISELVEEGEDTMFEQGRISAFEDVKVFINHTLEVKEVGVDLGDPNGDKSSEYIVDTKTLEVKDDVVSNDTLISPELLTASAAYARGQLANPDYPTYNDEYELLCAFEAGAKWQEAKIQAQSMAVAHGCPKETVIYGQDQTMNSSNKFSNICQTTKR